MPPSSPTNRKLSNPSPTRNQLVERCSTLRGCEPCKRRKRICNGQRPCTHCTDASQDCVYSVVSDHPRSVFTTSTARRLSSGSACETCRRRKTKCDGCSPCSFCASSGIECINNSERRKRSVIALPSQLSTNNTTAASAAAAASGVGDHEAIDRIEDRLRRIEKLMTAFTPSPLSQSTPGPSSLTKEIKDLKKAAAGFRKMSSPHLHRPVSASPRQQRHSIHGISREHSNELHRNKLPYASPPNSNGSTKTYHPENLGQQKQFAAPSSPPPSPRLLKQSYSQHTNTTNVASSMLNLSLSPSSSSTSSSSYMQPSISTPTSPRANKQLDSKSWQAPPVQKEWKQSTPIPSLMDQLSKCTFVTTAMDYTTVHYPIYPISSTTPNAKPSNSIATTTAPAVNTPSLS